MSKHTPGPWAIEYGGSWIASHSPDAGKNNLICDRPAVGNNSNWLANAHLIAAAPDAYAIIRAEYDSHNGFKTLPIGYPPERAEAITNYIRKVEGHVQP